MNVFFHCVKILIETSVKVRFYFEKDIFNDDLKLHF